MGVHDEDGEQEGENRKGLKCTEELWFTVWQPAVIVNGHNNA